MKHTEFREYDYYPKNFKLDVKSGGVVEIFLSTRTFELRIANPLIFIDFVFSIIKAFSKSSTIQVNRFDSFSQIYENNDAKYYVNGAEGCDYFGDLYYALEEAEGTVFINDWFLSP